MIVHIVLCKAAENLDDQGRQDLADALRSLGRLEQVQSISWGPNVGHRSKGYTHAAVMHLASWEDLEAYLSNPEHLKIVDVLNRVAPERLVMDYETATSGISGTTDSDQKPSR